MSGLECRGLGARYGSAEVLRELNLAVGNGQVVALLGPNGAGKSTALCTLAGLRSYTTGSVVSGGRRLRAGNTRDAAKAGVLLVPDDRALFSTLTVSEHMRLATKSRARIDEAMELFPRLTERAAVPAGLLSGGEQQMLAIARALVQDPNVLLIDELSMGLAPVVVESLLALIRQIADERGTAVVLVEQHVSLALRIADRAVVIAHGEVVLEGAADDLARDPAAIELAYLS